KGALARYADQGRRRLARHVDRDHRAPLRPLHQASRRRSDPRSVARYLAASPGPGPRRRLARLSRPVARTLTDQAWAEIRAAAQPHRLNAKARAMLSAVLFEEYPVFAYNRERVAMRNERVKRMLEYLDAFAELSRQDLLPELPDDQFQAMLTGRAIALTDDLRTEAYFWWIA